MRYASSGALNQNGCLAKIIQKLFKNGKTLERSKDNNAELKKYAEFCCLICKISLDTAESEPRKDPEKYII